MFLPEDGVPKKNPKQGSIDWHTRNLTKLPVFSDKPFLHAAFIYKNDPLNSENLEAHIGKLDLVIPDWFTMTNIPCSVYESIDWGALEVLQKTPVRIFPHFSNVTPL